MTEFISASALAKFISARAKASGRAIQVQALGEDAFGLEGWTPSAKTPGQPHLTHPCRPIISGRPAYMKSRLHVRFVASFGRYVVDLVRRG